LRKTPAGHCFLYGLDWAQRTGHISIVVKNRRHTAIKKLEAVQRATVVRSRGSRGATRIQRRVSLVGDGAKWRVTNLPQVFAAMAKWA